MNRHRRRFGRVVDDLTGRSHRRIVQILLAQVDAAVAGVDLARQATTGAIDSAPARNTMAQVEHAGDSQRAQLVVELSRTLTTPIDREDLFRLSRSVDDVLDNLRDYVREIDLYAVRPGPLAGDALAGLRDGLQQLRTAVSGLAGRPREVAAAALQVRKRGGRVRQLYQLAMTDLFAQKLSADLLKRRELLRRLDVVGLRLGECADALSDAMLKRSL